DEMERGDAGYVDRAIARGDWVKVPGSTPVNVLERRARPNGRIFKSGFRGGGLDRHPQRIVGWGGEGLVGDPPDAKPSPATGARSKPAEPDRDKAAAKLRQAKALEKANPKGAIGYYREVVRDYPDTPEAKTAAERIEALQK